MTKPNNTTSISNLDAVTHIPPPEIESMEGPLDHLNLDENLQRNLGRVFKGLIVYNLQGLQLLKQLRENFSQSMHCHPEVVICYDIYEKIKLFLEERLVSSIITLQSGEMSGGNN